MKYTTYVRREMCLEFEVEAESPEKAAELAMTLSAKHCTDIEELDSGQTFGARVYAEGAEEYGEGQSFETEAGKLRDAAGEMLVALEYHQELSENEGNVWVIDHIQKLETMIDAAIAKAKWRAA
jgi:hypothetical protein